MKRSIIAITKGDTPQATRANLAAALDEAYAQLGSYKSKENNIDIILAHDDGSHNYQVLVSLVAKPISNSNDREIAVWQNEKALEALGVQIQIDKKLVIKQLLDKAFKEVGNLYDLISFRCEQMRVNSVYDWLMQMIDANFELKENYGRI